MTLTTLTVRSFTFERSRCCERTLAGEVKWLDGPAGAGQGGFEDLVWSNTETGVKMRSAADIAAGDKWAPLIAPVAEGEALKILINKLRTTETLSK